MNRSFLAALVFITGALVLPHALAADVEGARRKSAQVTAEQMSRAWDLFEAGTAAARAGNRRAALSAFLAGLDLCPGEVRIRFLVADLLEAEGKSPEAGEQWQLAEGLAQTNADKARASAALKRLGIAAAANDASTMAAAAKPLLPTQQEDAGNTEARERLAALQALREAEARREREAQQAALRAREAERAQKEIDRLVALYNQAKTGDAGSFGEIRQSALRGHADAQNFAGVCYLYGFGTDKDVMEAARWWVRSARQGNAHAAKNLEMLRNAGYMVDVVERSTQ